MESYYEIWRTDRMGFLMPYSVLTIVFETVEDKDSILNLLHQGAQRIYERTGRATKMMKLSEKPILSDEVKNTIGIVKLTMERKGNRLITIAG